MAAPFLLTQPTAPWRPGVQRPSEAKLLMPWPRSSTSAITSNGSQISVAGTSSPVRRLDPSHQSNFVQIDCHKPPKVHRDIAGFIIDARDFPNQFKVLA